MTIDPEKLLQLARERQGGGGVTLGWPTVLKIIEELHRLQALEEALGECLELIDTISPLEGDVVRKARAALELAQSVSRGEMTA